MLSPKINVFAIFASFKYSFNELIGYYNNMESRISYIRSLTYLQVLVLCIQAVICSFRIFKHEVFSLLNILSFLQPVLMYLIIFHKQNVTQCQIYVCFAICIIYLIAVKQIMNWYNYFAIHQSYIDKLYWIEVLFRIYSIHIGWRSYCAYTIFVSEGVGNQEDTSFLQSQQGFIN